MFLCSQAPISRTTALPAISVEKLPPGTYQTQVAALRYLVDFGQNAASTLSVDVASVLNGFSQVDDDSEIPKSKSQKVGKSMTIVLQFAECLQTNPTCGKGILPANESYRNCDRASRYPLGDCLGC